MNPTVFSYQSMGTTWKITIWDSLTAEELVAIEQSIKQQSEDFDKTYSRFIKDSLVWKIAQNPGVHAVPKDFMVMLGWYKKLYKATDKKLNPLIGHTISDLGYDADYSLIPKDTVRKTPDLDTIRIIDESHIETTESVLFDFGALGKGYFVDVIAIFLKSKGCKHFLVDGSGDIYYEGKGEVLRVGLEHPGDATKVIGVVELKQGGMCGSGTNRRKWGKYHHVIDPVHSEPTQGIIATWVISESAVLSDALASCLFFVRPERVSSLFSFEYCILNEEYKVNSSAGFNAELF